MIRNDKTDKKYHKILAEKEIELAGIKIKVGVFEYKIHGHLVRKPYASKMITDSVPVLQAEIRKLQKENERLKSKVLLQPNNQYMGMIIGRQILKELLIVQPLKTFELKEKLMVGTNMSEGTAKLIIQEAKTEKIIKKRDDQRWCLINPPTISIKQNERGLSKKMVFEKVIKTYGGVKAPNTIRFSKNAFTFYNFKDFEGYNGIEIYIDKDENKIGFKPIKENEGSDCYGLYHTEGKQNVCYTNKGKMKKTVLTVATKQAKYEKGLWVCDDMEFS